MLLQLPLLCQIEILKKLPPTSVDNVALVCKHLGWLVKKCRKDLAKPRVFMTVTQELNGKDVTLCLYLHPIHYNENMEQCMKRRIFKQFRLPLTELCDLNLEQHFGFFELESILLTSRYMELSPISLHLIGFTDRLFKNYFNHIRYFGIKCLDFKTLDETSFSQFLDIFEKNNFCLDMLKVQCCNFQDTNFIYRLFQSPLLSRTRNFRELCTTKEDSVLTEEIISAFSGTGPEILLKFLDLDCPLEGLELCSIAFWPFGSVRNFVESWCQMRPPKLFKKLSLMKTNEFEHIVTELKEHPWVQNRERMATEPLIFKNRNNNKFEVRIFVDSPLYFVIQAVDVRNDLDTDLEGGY
ncbi:hypothetical protein FO519_001552 [Halicephalobus sp. NKZ332]|nr:hypothetical protein FO519_001552 [Halicephalobus sp. NKZ332]